MVLVRLIFVLFCIVEVERGFKAGERGFPLDFRLGFFEDFQAILYHEFHSPLRKIVHFFRADAKESLPAELLDAH